MNRWINRSRSATVSGLNTAPSTVQSHVLSFALHPSCRPAVLPFVLFHALVAHSAAPNIRMHTHTHTHRSSPRRGTIPTPGRPSLPRARSVPRWLTNNDIDWTGVRRRRRLANIRAVRRHRRVGLGPNDRPAGRPAACRQRVRPTAPPRVTYRSGIGPSSPTPAAAAAHSSRSSSRCRSARSLCLQQFCVLERVILRSTVRPSTRLPTPRRLSSSSSSLASRCSEFLRTWKATGGVVPQMRPL